MNIIIRQETEKDYKLSETVVEKAFKNAEHTDHKEHLLVAKLRKSDAFIPELSLVAELDGEIVGHIMLTKLLIENEGSKYDSLALAPVSVVPEHQNKGIGSELISESLKIAKELGFKSVIVLGHDKYYPRFGFKPASTWGIKAPFDVPDEAFMALELEDGSLEDISGTVVYSKEFSE
ncbi:TPA: GNAT family N-acetyltransferase [Streptococcus agalactiae]|jgi:predicted N-acetyltransferase YhbS|uniref:GNAT family N-acetyltransferase n=1 Tax=Bacillota TaxID=1239 RepID=UPI0016256E76|nr:MULTISPECIES: N-acetyltransferase [Bacillota]MBC2578664.1 N-acetyltransferase [Peptostreptococcus russellii]HEM3634022.1 N-acetyltransferase [Streptococcus suis]HEM3634564.1 N-acetyltransferase [Streptococcus suis]